MALIEWEAGFQLGIKQFDVDHKHLVGLLNKTYDDFLAKKGFESIGLLLDELIDYATYHFAAEEQWMKERNYAGLEQHRAEHESFSQRVVEIQKDFHRGKTTISLEIILFLKTWLVEHIQKVDADYCTVASR